MRYSNPGAVTERLDPTTESNMIMMRKWLAVTGMAVVMTLGGLGAAQAGETVGRGILSGVHDNVIVPSGFTCLLHGAIVKGNVKTEKGASLDLYLSQVGGNVEVEGGPGFTTVEQSEVGGNVLIKEGSEGNRVVVSSRIGGNVQINETKAPVIVLGDEGFGNFVGGSVQAKENTSPLLIVAGNSVHADVHVLEQRGPSEIRQNIIGGNLQSKENKPPSLQVGNNVRGSIDSR
jgi:hypothetical protein